MEKLIELLNEYELGKDNYSGVISEGDIYYYSVLYISKEYGFIKWLVENDKVRIPHELDELPAMYGYDYDSAECKADRLLMLLSISDTPIEDLISYLK